MSQGESLKLACHEDWGSEVSKNSHVLMKEKREMSVDIGYHNKETVKIAVRGLVVGNS